MIFWMRRSALIEPRGLVSRGFPLQCTYVCTQAGSPAVHVGVWALVNTWSAGCSLWSLLACTNDQRYNTLNQYVCRQEVSFLFLGQSVITWSSHLLCFDHRHTLHVALPPSSFHSPSSEVPLSSHSYFQRSRPCPLPHPPGQLLYVQPFVHASCDLCMTECVDACMLGKGPRDLPPFTKQMRNLLCGWLYCLCGTQSWALGYSNTITDAALCLWH